MTAIPLSMREGHGQTLSGSDAPRVPHSDDNSQLDKLIDSVTETITSRESLEGDRDEGLLDAPANDDDSDTWRVFKAKLDDPEAPPERGPHTELDRTLKAAVDRRASQEVESADFRQSKEWRDTLDQRYAGRIAIGDLLDTFADWHERLKMDPRAAADAISAAYLEQPPYVLPGSVASNRDGTSGSAAGKTPDQELNGVLAAAIDRHHGKGDGEQQAFAASARHRAALKEMFPGMTYAEACRRVVMLDGDLHQDPIGTAARLAATYHMPVTSSQQAVVEQRGMLANDAQSAGVAAAEHLPDLAELEDDVVTVLGRPDFIHGPDMQENLSRAHRIARLIRHK